MSPTPPCRAVTAHVVRTERALRRDRRHADRRMATRLAASQTQARACACVVCGACAERAVAVLVQARHGLPHLRPLQNVSHAAAATEAASSCYGMHQRARMRVQLKCSLIMWQAAVRFRAGRALWRHPTAGAEITSLLCWSMRTPAEGGSPSQLPRFIQVELAGEALDERRTSMSEASPSSSAKSSAVRPSLSRASSLTLESASRKRTEGSEPISIAWCSAV
jgi:hypothetical protein